MMVDLSTTYLGIQLRTPIVASASPRTGALDDLVRLEDAGVAAAVLPSLFEEQLVNDAEQIDRMLSTLEDAFADAPSFFPDLSSYNTGPESYLDLISDARRRLSIPVIASLNGTTLGGWTRYATRMQDAGASALELNIYLVAADPSSTSHDVERRHLDLVAAVREQVDIPVAVKIGPYFSSLPSIAHGLVDAGADGLVLFNRFYQPDIDLETLTVQPRLVLSTSEELRLPLRWIAILSGGLNASLALSTGVHTSDDVVKGLLAGADVTMTTSALLQHGPRHVGVLERGLRDWMTERGYTSVRQLKGSVSQQHAQDPEAFARANYIQMLSSYAPRVQP